MAYRLRPPCLSVLLICLSAARALAAFPVDLTVQNPNTVAWDGLPVTSGVPLLRGQVSDVSQLALVDGAGNPVPAQFLPIMTYTDGTPRWVLVDLQPAAAAGASSTYRIVKGAAMAHPTPLQITQTSTTVTVNTGVAVFVMNKLSFNLFDSVMVNGVEVVAPSSESGIVVTRPDNTVWRSNFGPATFTIEDQGPLHTVVKVTGEHRLPGPGTSHLLEYKCRIHFYAGQSVVKIFFTVGNQKRAGHSGNRWDPGQFGYEDIKDVTLQLRTTLGAAVNYTAQGNSGTAPMTGAVQGSTYLYQCSSGGSKWNHDHHMDREYVRYHQYPDAFSGWRLMRDGQQVSTGSRAIGWMDFADGNKGVAAGMRHFWQNCPKAIEINGQDVFIRVLPKYWQGNHGFEFEGGLQKTTECLLYFHSGAGSPQQVMTGLNNPLFARCSEAHYADTFAFEYLGAYNPTSYPKLETYMNSVISNTTSDWESYDEYGWEDFGCIVADHEMGVLASPWNVNGINHYGNEYFATEGFMIQFVRKGNLNFLEQSIVQSRHMYDIHIYHTDPVQEPSYAGGYFLHTTHDMPALRAKHRIYAGECDGDYTPQLDQILFPGCPNDIWAPTYNSGGPGDPGHLDTPYYYYFMTGDRTAYDGILETAAWALRAGIPTSRGREPGNFLFNLTYAYELTHDAAYKNKIIQTMNTNSVQTSQNWSTSWYIDSLCRFILWKRLNNEHDADYTTAVNHVINWSNTYLNYYTPSSSYWHYHDFDALALLYLSLPEYHANRAPMLAKANADKAAAEGQVPTWFQAKDWSVLTNSGNPHMYIAEGRITPPWPGDINHDGYVDVEDLLDLVAAFGTASGDPAYNAAADFNYDGLIDVVDLLDMVYNFGQT